MKTATRFTVMFTLRLINFSLILASSLTASGRPWHADGREEYLVLQRFCFVSLNDKIFGISIQLTIK